MSSILCVLVVLVAVAGAKELVTEQNIHDCIVTELVSDVAARICSEVGLDAQTRLSVGRKVCTRITRCLLVHNFVEDRAKGIVFPKPCGLSKDASDYDERLCANSIVNASLVAQDMFLQCLGKAESQCGKVSMTALFKQGEALSSKVDRTEAWVQNVSTVLHSVGTRLESFSANTTASLNKQETMLAAHGLDIQGLQGTIRDQTTIIQSLQDSNNKLNTRLSTLSGELGNVRQEMAELKENWNLRGMWQDTIFVISIAVVSVAVIVATSLIFYFRRPVAVPTAPFTLADLDVAMDKLLQNPTSLSGYYLRSGKWYAPPSYATSTNQ
jgi:hypothetical protein